MSDPKRPLQAGAHEPTATAPIAAPDHGVITMPRNAGGAVPVISMQGEITPDSVTAAQRLIADALGAGSPRIVVDLSTVSVMGTHTLAMFCEVLRRLQQRDATLVIVPASAPMLRAIELCLLDGVELHPQDAAEARVPCVADPSALPKPARSDRSPGRRGPPLSPRRQAGLPGRDETGGMQPQP